jgi:uncharacterized protein YjbI with pentapeptide repeats
MPKKSSLLLHFLNLVVRPAGRETPPSSNYLPQQSPADDREAWSVYWKERGQPWRTEPEIDINRQQELAQRRAIVPDIQQGIYPFKGMKLTRADVEWLLATHENGRGPVDWSDESQRDREGLDLRGADLSQLNLSSLPLTHLRAGLTRKEAAIGEHDADTAAAAFMKGANLSQAHLEGAVFNCGHLEEVNFRRAHLREASFEWGYLQKANFQYAHLEQALFTFAHLEEARLADTHLEEARLGAAHLERAHLQRARLDGAHLPIARLEGANLLDAHLEGANLLSVHFEDTRLDGITLKSARYHVPRVADVHWGDTNLSVVRWSQVDILGDEYEAKQKRHTKQRGPYQVGDMKDEAVRLEDYDLAARAYRQLAIALQNQGLNEIATRFAYCAQVLQKRVWWFQMMQHNIELRQRVQALGAWLFSWFLFLLAGYGYKLWRSFFAYLLIISCFMTLYRVLDPHLAWNEAFVVSMTAFHGRGFSPSTFTPGDAVSLLSALEAFIGLIIEVTFIATLTQRFFNR